MRSIVETVARIGDELKRAFFIKRLAERFGLYESLLNRELEATLSRERKPVRGGPSGSASTVRSTSGTRRLRQLRPDLCRLPSAISCG